MVEIESVEQLERKCSEELKNFTIEYKKCVTSNTKYLRKLFHAYLTSYKNLLRECLFNKDLFEFGPFENNTLAKITSVLTYMLGKYPLDSITAIATTLNEKKELKDLITVYKHTYTVFNTALSNMTECQLKPCISRELHIIKFNFTDYQTVNELSREITDAILEQEYEDYYMFDFSDLASLV